MFQQFNFLKLQSLVFPNYKIYKIVRNLFVNTYIQIPKLLNFNGNVKIHKYLFLKLPTATTKA